MNKQASVLAATLLVAFSMGASATIRYVDLHNPNPTPPYTDWAGAAASIQEAIDAATAGDQILVTNGVYQTGGRVVYGALSNRVAVTKPVTVQSVNGPAVTVIQGYPVTGDSAVRGVYLTNGAALIGFTVTGGAVRTTGGNREYSGAGVWCESQAAMLSNCIVTGNSAWWGGAGGVYAGSLSDCLIISNTASRAGGVQSAWLNRCVVGGNSAGESGGANNCTFTHCVVTNNDAYDKAGGVTYSTLNNCFVSGNFVHRSGAGGVYFSKLTNCTVTANSAGPSGVDGSGGVGGVLLCFAKNCIIYYNTGPGNPNFWEDGTSGVLDFCCTTPLPRLGTGNLSVDPQLASLSHLSASSPCRQAGNPVWTTGFDLDGEFWASPPPMGCDQYRAGAVTGPLSASLQVTFTNVSVGFPVYFTADIQGRASASRWEFGDGTVISNRPYASHAWTTAGDFPVVLRVYNETYPAGVSTTGLVQVVDHTYYVARDSANPVPPYTSWATAATNIQEAVDAASAGGTVVVSNGVYDTGGRLAVEPTTNRVAIDKPLTVQSVNGPAVTLIAGYQVPGTLTGTGAVCCVYLGEGATLTGFTLTNGAIQGYYGGGGVSCASTNAFVRNCWLLGNAGGGAYSGTLEHCLLSGNVGGGAQESVLNACHITHNADGGVSSCRAENCVVAFNSGCGVHYGVLYNCTIVSNISSSYGGGVFYATLNNCIIYYNKGPSADDVYSAVMTNCCTTPRWVSPADGIFTNAPAFVDLAGGDLRLRPDSPCINAGNTAAVTSSTDLDGNPRVVGSRVDVGAYEFQAPGSGLPYAWLQTYGLPTDPSIDQADSDGDGMNNVMEWRCSTDPTNAASIFRLLQPRRWGGTSTLVSWQSVDWRRYFVECSTNLVGGQPAFVTIATNLPGQNGQGGYWDNTAYGPGPCFYRVGIHE